MELFSIRIQRTFELVSTRISFIEWYVTFLDMEIENINESLTHSTTA